MQKIFVLIFLVMVSILLIAVSKSSIFVESNRCVGCGDCEKVCPVDAVKVFNGKAIIDAEKCIKCEICIGSCTYNAIRKNNED